jgi:hypothetical protein
MTEGVSGMYVCTVDNQPIGAKILTKKENRGYVITAAIGLGLLVAALVTFLLVQASGNTSGLPPDPFGISYDSMVSFQATLGGGSSSEQTELHEGRLHEGQLHLDEDLDVEHE